MKRVNETHISMPANNNEIEITQQKRINTFGNKSNKVFGSDSTSRSCFAYYCKRKRRNWKLIVLLSTATLVSPSLENERHIASLTVAVLVFSSARTIEKSMLMVGWGEELRVKKNMRDGVAFYRVDFDFTRKRGISSLTDVTLVPPQDKTNRSIKLQIFLILNVNQHFLWLYIVV